MKIKYLLSSALVAAFLTGIYLFQNGMYSISSDETSRSLISYYWSESGKIESTSWLPLQFLITGIGFYLINDLIILPRLISLLFGLLTIAAVTFLAAEIFKKKEVVIFTLIIAVFIPQRMLLSVVPLPEIIYFFFITSGALYFYKWLSYNKHNYLYISALLIAVSCSLRYEGWIFALTLIVYSFIKVKNAGTRFMLFFILSAFPVFWFIFNYIKFGSLIYFLNEPEDYYLLAQERTIFNTIIFNPFIQFIEQNLITLNAAGLAGLYFLRKNKNVFTWIIIFYIPLVLFSLAALTGKPLPAHNFWRTSAVWVILLIPFTAYVLFRIKENIKEYPGAVLLPVLFFIQLIIADIYYIKNIKQEYCLTRDKINAAGEIINYVKKNGETEDRILIERLNTFEHLDITLASQDPYRFILSKKNDIVPEEEEEYADADIGYYLVKTPALKEVLINNRSFSRELEINGWILFSRRIYLIDNKN